MKITLNFLQLWGQLQARGYGPPLAGAGNQGKETGLRRRFASRFILHAQAQEAVGRKPRYEAGFSSRAVAQDSGWD